MPASTELYPAVVAKLQDVTAGQGVRITAVRRLALIITGLVAAKSSVLSQVAVGLWEQGVSTVQVASIGRRLRRTLADGRLSWATWYAPAARTLIAWERLVQRGKPVILALDESTQEERVQLLRVSLTYWGTALPLAWRIWPRATPLEAGAYWQAIDTVLDRVASLLPPGLAVIMTADRAYDIPPFIDRIAARGWHWVVRLKANGTTRFRDHRGREHSVKTLVERYVAAPGQRWKARGWLFKKAGWRPVSLVATWTPGAKERLVVITDLPPRWTVLAHYDRRFWIEPGFRTDKASGWQWEACQVTDLDHLDRLLVAMAWATLLVLYLGLQTARASLRTVSDACRATAAAPTSRRPPKPQPAHASLFTLGLRLARRWLARSLSPPASWRLTHLDAPTWTTRWRQAQSHRFLFAQTVRP
jgi:hypothetical protein